MAIYLFPFASVHPNARIIIYGCGDMGRQFLAQLVQSDYANVVTCVDQAGTEIKYFPVPVKTIENVEWQGDWYDYVVIAIRDRKISAGVLAVLMRYGVPKEKIVLSVDRELVFDYLSKNQMLDVFNNEETLKNVLAAYCNSKYKSIDLLYDMRVRLCEYDTLRFRGYLKKVLREQFLCADEKAVLLQQIYLAGMFDADFVKIMLSVIPRMSRWQDGYVMLKDLCFVDGNLDNHIDWRYSEYYQEMRNVIKSVFDRANLYMVPRKNDGKIRRVVFSTVLIHSVRYALGAIIPLMNSLAENGVQVGLFSLGTAFYDENELPDFVWQPISKRYDMCSHGVDAQGYATYLEEKKFYHSSIEVYDSYKLPVAVKLQEYLDKIDYFCPDIIVMFVDDGMPISYIMSKYYPVVQIPTKRLVSAMYFHAFITSASKEKCLYENKDFHSLPDDRICTCPSDGLPFMGYLDQRKYIRKEFGLVDDDFVVVTVGLRLEQELTEELISSMAEILEKNVRVKWLLVYRNEPKQVHKYEHLISRGNIVLRGWEDNLPALYEICDACLNPEREGGGVSLRLAMQAGLPVVSQDVPPLAGFFLPENFVVGGAKEMAFELEKLVNDNVYYKMKSDLMKRLMINCKQDGIESFVAILQKIYNKFYAGEYS